MGKQLNPWYIELDDELKDFEIFKGIKELTDEHGNKCIVGVVELWETASHLTSERYCNIKFYQK